MFSTSYKKKKVSTSHMFQYWIMIDVQTICDVTKILFVRTGVQNFPPSLDKCENSIPVYQTLHIHHSAEWRSNMKYRANKQNTLSGGWLQV